MVIQRPRLEDKIAHLPVEWKPGDIERTLRYGQFVPRFPETTAVSKHGYVVGLRRYLVLVGQFCAVVHKLKQSIDLFVIHNRNIKTD